MIDQLADLIHQGWQIPFTQYRSIRGREVDQLLERMRINVPSSIRESERTVGERDQILAEAKADADQIVENARRQAMEMINERALLETARHESQRIVEESQKDARHRIDDADRYTVGALHGLREELRALIHQVDSGIAMMEGQTVSRPVPEPQPTPPLEQHPELLPETPEEAEEEEEQDGL